MNDDFRSYFEEHALPEGTCATDGVRCSGCWRAGLGGEAERPALYAVLTDAAPRTGRPTEGERRAATGRAARHVERLLRFRWRGLHPAFIYRTLRGTDPYFHKASQTMKPLWPELVATSVFGVMPSISWAELDAALSALVAAGRVVIDDRGIARHIDHVRRDEARATWAEARAAEAAEAAASGAGSPGA